MKNDQPLDYRLRVATKRTDLPEDVIRLLADAYYQIWLDEDGTASRRITMTEQDPNFLVGDNDHGDAVPTTVADIVKQLTDDNIMLRREIKDLQEQVKVMNECLNDRQKQLDDAINAKKWFMGFYDKLHENACEEHRLREDAEKKYNDLLDKVRGLVPEPYKAKPPRYDNLQDLG